MKYQKTILLLNLALVLSGPLELSAAPLGTAFTYQEPVPKGRQRGDN